MVIATATRYPEGSEIKKALLAAVPDLPESRTSVMSWREVLQDRIVVEVRWQSKDGEVHTHMLGQVDQINRYNELVIEPESMDVLRVRAKMTACL